MLVLGIKKQQNNYEFAVVESGNKLIDSGKLSVGSFKKGISNILAKHKIKLVALSAEDTEEHLDLSLPSTQVHWELAANYQIDVDTNEPGAYPAVLLIDKPNLTSVHVVSDKEKQQQIAQHKDQSLSQLLGKLEDILEIASIKNHALQGDSNAYNLQEDFSKRVNNFDFQYIAEKLVQSKQQFLKESKPELSPEVAAEVLKYFKFDISASILQLLYEQIIYFLITQANELGINNLRVVGNVAEDVDFRALLTKISEDNGYRVNFADKNINPAIGIAAAGFHLSYF